MFDLPVSFLSTTNISIYYSQNSTQSEYFLIIFSCSGQKISDSTFAHLLATNSSHHYVKCVHIYPRPEPDILLAVGQANGKVVLTTFGPTAFDSQGLTGKELGKDSIFISIHNIHYDKSVSITFLTRKM